MRQFNLRTMLVPDGAKHERASSSGFGLGVIFAALGAALFSLKAILIKLAYLPGAGAAFEVDAITLMALRMMFAGPIYLIIFLTLMRRRTSQTPLPRKAVLGALALGCLGYYICPFLDFNGLKFITAQLERLILFTYPAFVLILGALFFGATVSWRGAMFAVIAYAGIGVIYLGGDIASGDNVALGSTLVLACAVLFALFQLLAKPLIAQLGAGMFTCISMMAASTAVLSHFAIDNIAAGTLGTALSLPPRIWVLGAAIAIMSTLIPSFLVNIAIGKIGPQTVSMIGMISPIVTIAFAINLLGEPFGVVDALGTALTVGGIAAYSWYSGREKRALNKTV